MFPIWRCLPSESRQRPRLVLLVPVLVAIDATRIENDVPKELKDCKNESLTLFLCSLRVGFSKATACRFSAFGQTRVLVDAAGLHVHEPTRF